MNTNQISQGEFEQAIKRCNAIPEEPILGDARQYYSGIDGDTEIVLLEDDTGSETRYFQAPRREFG